MKKIVVFLILLLDSVSFIRECECAKCDQSKSSAVTSTSAGTSSRSTRTSSGPTYAESRVKTDRYSGYLPVEEYRSKHGTLVHTQHGASNKQNKHYSQFAAHRNRHHALVTGGKVIAKSGDGTSAIVRNTSGLAVYSTLTNRGGKSRPKILFPKRTYPRRRWQPIKGEGYGHAYLEWSEYGLGCSCDECGTMECQHYTGVCECHESVIGDKCDRCAAEYWGFASCQGCHPCNCEEASESRQCDEDTGQCKCRSGVTGQRCDRCKPGYWSYTEYGCTECTCRSGFSVGVGCDPVTGQCSCLPGVIGDNCEGCPDRWVLVEGLGCRECDDCVHSLLDTTDELNTLIYPVIHEYESAAQSYFLHQRLQVINDSVSGLSAKVDLMDLSEEDLKPVQMTLDDLFSEALEMAASGALLNGRASESASEGLTVRDQAREVLDSIFDGTDLIRDVISEINSLVIGLETGTGARIELAITEAERIVDMMNQINFTSESDRIRAEFNEAVEFLDFTKNVTYTGVGNQNKVDEAIQRLKDLQAKLKEMEGIIQDNNREVYEVDGMNTYSRTYGLESVKRKHEDIARLGAATQSHLKDSDNFTALARTNLESVEEAYRTIDSELRILKAANANLNDSVGELTDQLAEAGSYAPQAMRHAAELKRTAGELDDLLYETRHLTESALRAASAYDDIVKAINGAWEAAHDAGNASDKAIDLSLGVREDSHGSLVASKDKYDIADYKISQVERVLLPQLNEAQLDVKQLDAMNMFANDKLELLERQLDSIDGTGLAQASREAQQNAIQIDGDSKDLDQRVTTQYENLQHHADVARTLSKDIEVAQSDTKLALKEVQNIEEDMPSMQQTARELLNQKAQMQNRFQDVGARLQRLRRNITMTRENTNKIKVGIDFEQGSVLELKNPEDLSDTATSTELVVFIRTSDRFGLPLYLGTPVGGSKLMPRTSTDDFMAIELDEGYVRLTINLGSKPGAKPHHVINSAFVADNEWHKIYIKRVGKVVQLSVSSEDENRNEDVVTVENVLPGTFSILNLDPKISKLYVGGIPAAVEVDPTLMNTYYTGEMEELSINKRPIGLWNFVSRGPTDFPIKGAKERLVLKKAKSTFHEMRFDGSGYTIVDTKGHETSPSLTAIVSFKTFAEDGLIYLLKNGDNEYVSLEIRGGKVLYQHKFETGHTTLLSDGIYNDYQWHTIEATRIGSSAVTKIGGSDFKQSRSTAVGRDFTRLPEVMFFGGFPSDHAVKGVTNEDFRGCIRDAVITDVTVDFSRSRESIGSVPGCTVQEVTLVSFHRESPGYVKLSNPGGRGLQLVFKFRTDSPNGLLFYTETIDRSIYLSLSLAEGALVLRSAPGGEITTGSYTQYNDSNWHIVIATRENNEVRLDIDDYEKFSVILIQERWTFDGPAFFGGLPEYYSISAAAAAADTNFFGCIGDATLNGKIIDFAAAGKTNRPGAMLETCSLYKEITVKTYLPEKVMTSSTLAPLRECVLPVEPEEDQEVTVENGLRFDHIESSYKFGNKRDSRIEYSELPDNIRGDFVLSVDFRTEASEGIIFYAASISHRDFLTIYMKDGQIVFSFNPGSSQALMRSEQRYDDNQWHKLVAHRGGDDGRLELDGYIVSTDSISGLSKHIEHQPSYYFGGLNYDIVELSNANTEKTFLSFNGCLRGFRMNNKIVGGQRKIHAVSQCSYKVEPGAFFGAGKLAHAVVRPAFHVGLIFEMSVDIKPRKNSGVLMSVHGKRDFILLQMRDGSVELKVDNGKGIVATHVNMSNPFQVCDGHWHNIQVLKNKHIIVLTVDGVNAEPAAGRLGSNSADTNKPLFLGSQPRLSARRGNAVREKYVGCMRHVIINSDRVDMSRVLYVGEVNAGACPII